jgi:hypothetical protein
LDDGRRFPATSRNSATRCGPEKATADSGKKSLRGSGRFAHHSNMEHISDHDLERYHLGMVTDEEELAVLEEHLLGCPECAELAEETAQYVDTIRAPIIAGDFDL